MRGRLRTNVVCDKCYDLAYGIYLGEVGSATTKEDVDNELQRRGWILDGGKDICPKHKTIQVEETPEDTEASEPFDALLERFERLKRMD